MSEARRATSFEVPPPRVATAAHAVASLVLVALCGLGCAARETPGSTSPPTTRGPAAYTAEQLSAVVSYDEVALSPDGRELSYTSDRSGAVELYSVAIDRDSDGGKVGARRQRTHLGEHVTGPVYSPDGSLLLFESDHGGDERTDLFLLRGPGGEPEPLTHSDEAERSARFSPDGRSIAFESDHERPFRFNVEVMDLATRARTQLTHEPINVEGPRYSKDGRTIVAVKSGDDLSGELLVVDAAPGPGGGRVRTIAAPRPGGMLRPVDFLPDGRLLALATNEAGFQQLATVDVDSPSVAQGSGAAATSAVTFIGPGDWEVEEAEVGEDGTIAYSRNLRGRSELTVEKWLARAPDAGAAPHSYFAEEVLSVSWMEEVVDDLALSRDGRTLVAVSEAANHPPAICARVVGLRDPPGCALTVAAPELGQVAVARLSPSLPFRYPSHDGRELDAFLVRPRVKRLGSPPPLVVQVHGGPNSQARGAWSPMVQALAEAGFAVVSPNYRGSSGYGRAFEDLDNKDWGGGDLEDLLDCVAALQQKHEIDPARVAIVGGSYGGYMVLRALTARPAAFRAGVDMYGMPDLAEDYRITADRFGSWYETEMGTPEKDAALFRERSPIHALDQVRAPLLVLQGENDTNVPRAESDGLVSSLRARGASVDYVVYPGEGHGFTHRDHRLDAIARTVSFLSRVLKPAH